MSKTVTINKGFHFLDWLAQHEHKLTENAAEHIKKEWD